MNRRAVIGSLALLGLAVPRAAHAQSARKIYRIGILALPETFAMAGPMPTSPAHNALLRGLRELGYVYGEHFVTEPRGAADKPERFPTLAADLVDFQADVIVAAGPAMPVLKQATSKIPIVMGGAGDPVGSGYAQSLGHPGGNFTGLSLQTVDITGKRLELLKELVPGAVLWPYSGIGPWQAADTAAQARGWKLLSLGNEARQLAWRLWQTRATHLWFIGPGERRAYRVRHAPLGFERPALASSRTRHWTRPRSRGTSQRADSPRAAFERCAEQRSPAAGSSRCSLRLLTAGVGQQEPR